MEKCGSSKFLKPHLNNIILKSFVMHFILEFVCMVAPPPSVPLPLVFSNPGAACLTLPSLQLPSAAIISVESESPLLNLLNTSLNLYFLSFYVAH